MESFRRGVSVAVNYGGPPLNYESVPVEQSCMLSRWPGGWPQSFGAATRFGISHRAERPRWASDLADRGSSPRAHGCGAFSPPAGKSDGEHRHRVAVGAVEVGVGDVDVAAVGADGYRGRRAAGGNGGDGIGDGVEHPHRVVAVGDVDVAAVGG
jgi:hypothetical protein